MRITANFFRFTTKPRRERFLSLTQRQFTTENTESTEFLRGFLCGLRALVVKKELNKQALRKNFCDLVIIFWINLSCIQTKKQFPFLNGNCFTSYFLLLFYSAVLRARDFFTGASSSTTTSSTTSVSSSPSSSISTSSELVKKL